jgi:hypothetical protein
MRGTHERGQPAARLPSVKSNLNKTGEKPTSLTENMTVVPLQVGHHGVSNWTKDWFPNCMRYHTFIGVLRHYRLAADDLRDVQGPYGTVFATLRQGGIASWTTVKGLGISI